MAKDYVIDGGTGELDVGANALANRFDLPEAMIPQNLGQRYNIGGLVRMDFAKGTNLEMFLKTVNTYQVRIMKKLEVKSKVELFMMGNSYLKLPY